jgi:hypothetical protein
MVAALALAALVAIGLQAAAAATPSFGAKSDFATGVFPVSVAAADFDRDGAPDLAVANAGVNTVSVLLGDGAGGFGAKSDFAAGGGFSVAAADFDRDGAPDLAVANELADTISVLLNGVNTAPVANADAYSTDEDTALTVAAPGVSATTPTRRTIR